MPATCRECGSTNIEYDGARGDAACMTCGIVLEENAIVSDVTFAETASGQSMMVGQFVPQSGPHFVTPGFYGAKDSRDVTLVNGRKKISQVAAALDLYPNHVDQAQRLFQLAVEHNFIQGRKTQNVVAACLYIVCRRDKTARTLTRSTSTSSAALSCRCVACVGVGGGVGSGVGGVGGVKSHVSHYNHNHNHTHAHSHSHSHSHSHTSTSTGSTGESEEETVTVVITPLHALGLLTDVALALLTLDIARSLTVRSVPTAARHSSSSTSVSA